jgi:FAD/FMN-containing dehydrogenase
MHQPHLADIMSTPNEDEIPGTPPSIEQACAALGASSVLSKMVFFPGQRRYRAERKHYWSLTVRDLAPACVVRPTTTEQVAEAVRILHKFPGVPIAIKSGGHDPNPGDASTDGGVLISLRKMKGAEYDPLTKLAFVKPGGCWNDVLGDLERYGRTVVGGRLGMFAPEAHHSSRGPTEKK